MKRTTLFLFALTGCPGGNGTMTGDMFHPPQDLGPEGDGPMVPQATNAVVTGSDFTGGTGSINTIKLSDKSVTKAIDTTLDSDNDVRCVTGTCYVLDHTHGTVRLYDPKTWTNPVEIKTGGTGAPNATSNPHDVWPLQAST